MPAPPEACLTCGTAVEPRPGVLPGVRRARRPRPAVQRGRPRVGAQVGPLPRRLDVGALLLGSSPPARRPRGSSPARHRRGERHTDAVATSPVVAAPQPPAGPRTTTTPAKPAPKLRAPGPRRSPRTPSRPGRRGTATRSCSPRSRPAATGSPRRPRRRSRRSRAAPATVGVLDLLEIREPPSRVLRRVRRDLRLARGGPDGRTGVVRPLSERVRSPGDPLGEV